MPSPSRLPDSVRHWDMTGVPAASRPAPLMRIRPGLGQISFQMAPNGRRFCGAQGFMAHKKGFVAHRAMGTPKMEDMGTLKNGSGARPLREEDRGAT